MSKKIINTIKTSWNLGLLYANATDPRIERDVKAIERAYAGFAHKYQDNSAAAKNYTKNSSALLAALTDYEALFEKLPLSSAIHYFCYRKDLNSKDAEAEAHINILSERLTKASNTLLFFELSLGKIPLPLQKKFLADRSLAHFHYFLKLTFERSRHDLSEAEEKIMSLKAHPSHTLWINGSEKILNKQTIENDLPIAKAITMVAAEHNPARRKELHTHVVEKLRDISDFAEAEINAIVLNKKINDELRHFPEPYSQTILAYQNDEKTVLNLVKTVSEHASISHRFYQLKAKLLAGKDSGKSGGVLKASKTAKLGYQDRAASIGKIAGNFDLSSGVEILRKAFATAGASADNQRGFSHDPFYAKTLDAFLAAGQIDVYPRVGKTGGAYCSSNDNAPTFVLLNYINEFDSVMTFAHEMGHAIHSELSHAHQTPLYQGYTTSTAEVASTFFENFAFEELFSRLSDDEKIIALHDRINDDIQTIFRQIACFNFELELHRTIRAKGSMSKEEIAALMNKHMAAYLGPAVEMRDIDGYFFVYWGHIRRFFYVYSYAFGQLISKALYRRFCQDNNFGLKIRQFLSAGGSKSPEQIFRDIGIDVSKPQFFADGLRSIEDDIERLEKLTGKGKSTGKLTTKAKKV